MLSPASELTTAKFLMTLVEDECQRCRDGLDRGDTEYALSQAEKMIRHAAYLRYNLDTADLIRQHNELSAAQAPQGEGP